MKFNLLYGVSFLAIYLFIIEGVVTSETSKCIVNVHERCSKYSFFQMAGRQAIVDQATTVFQKVQEYIDVGMESTIEVTGEVIEQYESLQKEPNLDIKNK